MWNGTAPNLKAIAATTNVTPMMSPTPGVSASWADNAARSRVPVMPYNSDMP